LTAAALTVSSLHAGYDSYDVLRGVSIAVGAGERVGLFGPNGHGKTTLLNAISGTVRPRSGSIRFRDREISGCSPQEIVAAGLIQVPQGNVLFPTMQILEILHLAGGLGRAWARRSANLDRVFTLFPRLKERRRQPCRTLSGGERQMLAIGVGLMCEPEMLMLDEPTLGLSPRLKDELAVAIDGISRGSIPILLVEQDVAFVLSLVDRMYLVDHGEVTREVTKGAGIEQEEIVRIYFGKERAA
jgi:branched-chain amino acid transport system ATP-binding protein